MAQKLVTAIDNLSSSMVAKTEAITAAINSQSTALQSKLALTEAAMKAQTLTLESKLALLEKAIKALPDYSAQLEAIKAVIESLPDYGGKLDALANAIKALPDYSAQLEAIKTAIEALPNYGDKLTALENAIKALPNQSDKFDAVVAALNAMKTQTEVLGTGQTTIATQIGEVTAAINNLIASVNSGNTSAAAALAQIIAKLEELKKAIGSESTGGGTGGTVTPGGGGETPSGGGETPSGGGETPSTEDYVDLGLSVKWAKCNLGASKPSDYGDHYSWGETEPKADYTLATYKWMQSSQFDWITKYTFADGKTKGIWYDPDGTFIGDGKTTLEAADDAATQKLGSPWRMPTYDEIKELLDNCTWTWTTLDNVNGYEVKSKKNGNSIFLPAAGCRYSTQLHQTGERGCYWSSSLSAAYSYDASYLNFMSHVHMWKSDDRYPGFTVRPVHP